MADSIRDLFDALHRAKETRLTHENAPALVKWTEATAKKFNLSRPPLIFHLDHPTVQAYGGFAITRGGVFEPVVSVTEGMLKHTFDSPNLAREVPDGLKFILGHEIGHAAEGAGRMLMRRVPLFSIPFLALIGYEMYTHAERRHKEDLSKDLLGHLDAVAEEEKKKSMEQNEHRYNFFEASALDWGKRLAIVGGGLAAGGFMSRQLAMASEFAADRAGVLACGGPQAAIDTLSKMEQSMQNAFKEMKPKLDAWAKNLRRQSFGKKCSEIFEIAKMLVKEVTYGAHPSHPERYKAIHDFAIERGLHIPTL